jgi:hypothetical protein
MTEAALQAGSNRLPILASSINDHLAAAEQATKRGLEHAIAAGQLLLEAKEIIGHGGWLAWLEANCRVGVRQAQTFMRLARNRHKLEAIKNESAAYLTIATAEALVGRPRARRSHGLPRQLDLAGADWEVTAPAVITNPAYVISDRERINHHIVDLEYALAVLAVIRAEGPTPQGSPTLRDSNGRLTTRAAKEATRIAEEWVKRHSEDLVKQRARLAAAASAIERTLGFLRALRVRSK